jgi:hypothetical protein
VSSAPTIRCPAVRSQRPALTQNLRNGVEATASGAKRSQGDDDMERVEPEELFGRMRLRINEDARVEHALRI